MTVTYTLSVAESRLSGFPRLLIKWKGSIYKLLYREMVIFCFFYYVIHLTYHRLLNHDQKRIFNKLSDYCDTYTNFIPLSFVLGFYVTMVVTRWWQQWLAIPWPDKLAMLISAFVTGTDDRSKTIRITLMRYMLTMQCLTFQAISTSIRKRFPSEEDLIEAGLMTSEELEVYSETLDSYGRWWLPGQWFTSLLMEAYREGRVRHEMFLREIINEMHVFRGNCGSLFAFDWISIPLVYTQTVTIAVYTYFGAKLIGRQYTIVTAATVPTVLHQQQPHPNADLTTSSYNDSDIDSIISLGTDTTSFTFYIPFFTIAEFFFFMGWLKVAEQLINPFGEDDDDYDCNWILDRNIFVSFMIVDKMNQKHPDLGLVITPKPEIVIPPQPTTETSQRRASINPHSGSTMNLTISKQRRPSRSNNSINFLDSMSNEKIYPNSEVDNIDETNNNNNAYEANSNQKPLDWEHRTMSFCVPSGNAFQLAESLQVGGRRRKLSLEESRSVIGKPMKPTSKLQTHVECNEDVEANTPENELHGDEIRLLLNQEETET